jgi:hypothetical protein
VATVSGGAIYIVGVTTYRVLDTIFLGNAVVPVSWSKTVSYALHIFTGAMGTGSGYGGLMWSVDNGPVFGLSAADCSTAQNSSVRGIERGLAPSWPSAAPCATDSSYEPLNLYTRTLKLEEGDHVLHIGAMAYTADSVQTWSGGAWIGVDGLLDPTFPRFVDDRAVLRYPGCLASPGYALSCPGGEAVWIEVPLHVAVGQVWCSSYHHAERL